MLLQDLGNYSSCSGQYYCKTWGNYSSCSGQRYSKTWGTTSVAPANAIARPGELLQLLQPTLEQDLGNYSSCSGQRYNKTWGTTPVAPANAIAICGELLQLLRPMLQQDLGNYSSSPANGFLMCCSLIDRGSGIFVGKQWWGYHGCPDHERDHVASVIGYLLQHPIIHSGSVPLHQLILCCAISCSPCVLNV